MQFSIEIADERKTHSRAVDYAAFWDPRNG